MRWNRQRLCEIMQHEKVLPKEKLPEEKLPEEKLHQEAPGDVIRLQTTR